MGLFLFSMLIQASLSQAGPTGPLPDYDNEVDYFDNQVDIFNQIDVSKSPQKFDEEGIQEFGRQLAGAWGLLGDGGTYSVPRMENGRVTIDFFPTGGGSAPPAAKPVKKGVWDYVGTGGHEYWGQMNKKCLGKSQSPINVDPLLVKTVGRTGDLKFENYNGVNHMSTMLENNGHTVELKVLGEGASSGHLKMPREPRQHGGSGGPPTLSGGLLQGSYKMLQLHFHWGDRDSMGSEHTIDRARFPLEMHLVHISNTKSDPMNMKGGLAVTGFMFQISASDNPQMQGIIDQIRNIRDPKTESKLTDPKFNVGALIQPANSGQYFSYDGSLTTPGCNEVVQWLLFATPLKISSRQVAEFRTVIDGTGKNIVNNFRPVQPLNSRTVGVSA